MRQLTVIDAGQLARGRVTRRERFLAEMEQVVPWDRLEAVIEPRYPKDGKPGRRPYPLRAMLRCYLMQNGFGFSDPGTEDALYEFPSMRCFVALSRSVWNCTATPDGPRRPSGAGRMKRDGGQIQQPNRLKVVDVADRDLALAVAAGVEQAAVAGLSGRAQLALCIAQW